MRQFSIKRTHQETYCYKFFAILGSAILLTLFAGCGTNLYEENLQTDVMMTESILFSDAIKDPLIAAEKPVEKDQTIPTDWIHGAIITPDELAINELLNRIPHPDKVETVVLLSTNANTEGLPTIYENPGALDQLGIALSKDLQEKLNRRDEFIVKTEPHKDSSWNRPFMWTFSRKFSNAEFFLIELPKDDGSATEKLARQLNSTLPDESLVIALARPKNQPNQNLSEFQTHFTSDVLTRGEHMRYPDLPVHNWQAMLALTRYLQMRGTRHTAYTLTSQSTINILFDKGDTPPSSRSVHMVFLGDIMVGRYVRTLMDHNGLDYIFAKIDKSFLRSNDLLIGNLEGPITQQAVRHSDGMNFGFFLDTADLLKQNHFDLLSQANNHTLDKGEDAWKESMKLIRNAGMIPFGHQQRVTEESIAFQYIGNHKLAFLGLEDVNSRIDEASALAIIKRLAADDYKVIVYPHWGQEYMHQPNRRQKDLAYKFIDAGAFAIIGHHPHVEQAYENYKGRPIIYSLGNAIFDQYWSSDTQKGLAIAMTISDQQTKLRLIPLKLNQSQIELMPAEEAQQFLDRFATFGEYTEQESEQLRSGTIVVNN